MGYFVDSKLIKDIQQTLFELKNSNIEVISANEFYDLLWVIENSNVMEPRYLKIQPLRHKEKQHSYGWRAPKLLSAKK